MEPSTIFQHNYMSINSSSHHKNPIAREIATEINALYPDLFYFFEIFLQRSRNHNDRYVFKKRIDAYSFSQLLKSLGIQINTSDFAKMLHVLSSKASNRGSSSESKDLVVDLPLLLEVSELLLASTVSNRHAVDESKANHPSKLEITFETFLHRFIEKVRSNRVAIFQRLSNANTLPPSREISQQAFESALISSSIFN